MRAKIFQLEPVKKDEYKDSGYRLLNSFSFDDRMVFPDPTMIDWWSDTEDIKGSFSKLVSDLPNGMFVVNEDEMSLTYVMRPDNYIQEYLDKIKEKANDLTIENLYSYKVSLLDMETLIKQGCCDDMCYSCNDGYPYYFNHWIIEVAKLDEIGTKYYLGGVLDYHY